MPRLLDHLGCHPKGCTFDADATCGQGSEVFESSRCSEIGQLYAAGVVYEQVCTW